MLNLFNRKERNEGVKKTLFKAIVSFQTSKYPPACQLVDCASSRPLRL